MATTYCKDCNTTTSVVLDHSTGDTICTDCGLVLESHSIDQTSEWRTFSDDRDDPSRVGAPSNPLLAHGDLSTFISNPNASSSTNFHSSSAARSNGDNRDRRLTSAAFYRIADISDRLNVAAATRVRACEIFKKLDDHKPVKGVRKLNAMSAACLYIACREANPRPLKEICSAVGGVSEKEVVQAELYISANVKVEMKAINAGDFTKRFCHGLGMENHAIKAAQEIVSRTGELDIRRAPISVAAAVIYMVTQLLDEKFVLRDISKATGVTEGTIKKSYKDLYPYASMLIPDWLAKGQGLRKLAIP